LTGGRFSACGTTTGLSFAFNLLCVSNEAGGDALLIAPSATVSKSSMLNGGDDTTGGSMLTLQQDYHGWLLNQAGALQARHYKSIDWDNLAEELEAMAGTERRELLRRLTTVLKHLLKLAYQPGQVARRGNSWRRTIVRSHIEIERLLGQSPGLKGQLQQLAADAY